MSVPLFLSAWGKYLYGEWIVISTVMTYFQLGNAGFSNAAANEMTMSVANDNRAKALRIFQSTILLLLSVSAVLLFISSSVLFFPIADWLGFSFISNFEVSAIVFIFLVYVVLTIFVSLFIAVYRSEKSYHRGTFLYNIFMLVGIFGIVACLLLHTSPITIALTMTFSRVIMTLGIWLDIKTRFRWIEFGIRHARKHEMRKLIAPSMSFIAFPLGNALLHQGVVILIGTLIGSVEVVVFSSMKTLTNFGTRVIDVINHSFYPEITTVHERQEISTLRRLHKSSCQFSFLFGVAAMTLFIIFGETIFEIWMRGEVPFFFDFFIVLLIVFLLRTSWYTSFVIPSSVNRHGKISSIYISMCTLAVVINYIAVAKFNLVGTAVGLIFVEVVMFSVVLPKSLEMTQDTPWSFFTYIINPFNLTRTLLARHK